MPFLWPINSLYIYQDQKLLTLFNIREWCKTPLNSSPTMLTLYTFSEFSVCSLTHKICITFFTLS